MSRRYIGSLIDAFNALKVANAPTIGTASGGACGTASVAFTAPSCVGGGAVTGYTAVSCPGFKTGTGTTSPVTVTCLTNGTAYTFKVNATNVFGPSAFSAASSSATPFNAFGIFAFGNSSKVTNKYTFSSCTSAVGTSIINNLCNRRIAFGNNTNAFVGNNKWTFSGCTVAAKSCIPIFCVNNGSATGNSIVGIFATGANTVSPYRCCCFPVSQHRSKYTYSSCAVTTATNATTYSAVGSATGNSCFGIFALGSTCIVANTASTTRDKYTYSGDTVTSGAAASVGSLGGAAVGNSTIGIFAVGYSNSIGGPSTIRNKYTYSSNLSATATSSTVSGYYQAATGSSTVGVFQLGNAGAGASNTRNKYTYSGCVSAAATASSANVCTGVTGFSTAISGVNG